MPDRIDDLDDPRLADYRAVTDGELLARQGLFMAEGRLVVRTLLASSSYRPRSVLVTDAAFESLRDLLDPSPPCPVLVVEQSLMNELAGFNIHRGCLAAAERGPAQGAADLLAKVPPGPAMVTVLEDLLNHDNVGGVFRNAAAFGAAGVLLTPACVDPLYRKAIRVSMGAALRVPFGRVTSGVTGSWREWAAMLRERGFTIVALTPSPDAADIRDIGVSVPAPSRVALFLGSEGPGLSEGALRAADMQVRIPIAPGVDSLNVATAAGIAMHHFAMIR